MGAHQALEALLDHPAWITRLYGAALAKRRLGADRETEHVHGARGVEAPRRSAPPVMAAHAIPFHDKIMTDGMVYSGTYL